ncbi:hypothetical protein [Roseateles sp. LYH14W]|uniref:Uncharacterized protein n=1 Tax=Pelomonas parva TaxID=3299032 RepID=A0ABW7F5Z1_9BURK
MLDFINSKTGAFAAISTVVALAYALWRFWTEYQKREADKVDADKKRSLAAQGLAIADVHLSALDPAANACRLQFVVTNMGSAQHIMSTLRLHVTARREIDTSAPSVTMAPLNVHQHRVCLLPDKDVYDIRERVFDKDNPPLTLAHAETEAFVVKLVSEETMRFVFYVEVGWYAAAEPGRTGTGRTDSLEVAFPKRISVGPMQGSLGT